MKSRLSLKDIDFAMQLFVLAAWGAVTVLHMPSGERLALNFTIFSFWMLALIAWLGAHAWWRWRRPTEDERQRQIILMASYVSRQITLASVLLFLVVFEDERAPGPLSWPALMTALLVLPDMALRRYLGLSSAEMTQDRPAWIGAMGRILLISFIGNFLVLALAFRLLFARTHGIRPF